MKAAQPGLLFGKGQQLAQKSAALRLGIDGDIEDVERIGPTGCQRNDAQDHAIFLGNIMLARGDALRVVVEHRARGAPDNGNVVLVSGLDQLGDSRQVWFNALPYRRQG